MPDTPKLRLRAQQELADAYKLNPYEFMLVFEKDTLGYALFRVLNQKALEMRLGRSVPERISIRYEFKRRWHPPGLATQLERIQPTCDPHGFVSYDFSIMNIMTDLLDTMEAITKGHKWEAEKQRLWARKRSFQLQGTLYGKFMSEWPVAHRMTTIQVQDWPEQLYSDFEAEFSRWAALHPAWDKPEPELGRPEMYRHECNVARSGSTVEPPWTLRELQILPPGLLPPRHASQYQIGPGDLDRIDKLIKATGPLLIRMYDWTTKTRRESLMAYGYQRSTGMPVAQRYDNPIMYPVMTGTPRQVRLPRLSDPTDLYFAIHTHTAIKKDQPLIRKQYPGSHYMEAYYPSEIDVACTRFNHVSGADGVIMPDGTLLVYAITNEQLYRQTRDRMISIVLPHYQLSAGRRINELATKEEEERTEEFLHRTCDWQHVIDYQLTGAKGASQFLKIVKEYNIFELAQPRLR